MIKFIIFFISFIFLYSSEIKIFGLSSSLVGDTIEIKDGMLIKDGMIVSANHIIYNTNTKKIIAAGNVYINYDKNDYILSNKVTIDLKNGNISAEPFFLFNFKDNSWINSKEAITKNNLYFGKKSIASTCDVNNPDWKIVATSIEYNKQTKWINMYNPTLYMKDIPILYFPYIGFSLNKQRSSGFLRPIFGFSDNEGLLLTIPYYQTLTSLADLELDPTIRTRRGRGLYSTFRFVHSATSYGEFRIGFFRDFPSYQEKYNLANSIHRGWSFLYTNKEIITNNDKLYVDLKNANDTDYFYLDAYNYKFKIINDKILTSKINYYTTSGYNYFGVYGKYFKDTSKISNDDTMQILPQLNYHRFNDNFWNNFLVSVDANIYNYTRKEGYTAIKQSIIIPLSYNINFFDDYIKLSITEQFSAEQVDMSTSEVAKVTRLDTFLKVYTNLSKKYDSFVHHLSFALTFGMDNYFNYNGVESDYIDTNLLKKSIAVSLSQYLISNNWKINHKLSEVYYFNSTNLESKYSDLMNDISVSYFDFYLKNNNKYSLENHQINYNSFTIGYDDNHAQLELNYIYQRKLYNIDESKTYGIKTYWKFDKYHKLFGEYSYDLLLKRMKYQIYGLSMQKKCWNYSLSYKKEIVPLLTSDGISSITQRTIYFEIELVPLGGIEQQYQLKSN